MKFSLVIFSILLSACVFGETAEGYFINYKNDTVAAKVKIRKGIFSGINIENYYKDVELIDSAGNAIIWTPDEIKGFWFSYKLKEYKFLSKPIKRKGKLQFQEVLTGGSKTALYNYLIFRGGQYGSPQWGYTIEKKDSTYTYVTNYDFLSELSASFKKIYADVPGIAEFIDKKFKKERKKHEDIISIVEYANQ
jgi:hypothetical protein